MHGRFPRFDQMVGIVIEMLKHLLTPGAGPSSAPAASTRGIQYPETQDEPSSSQGPIYSKKLD